MAASDVGSRALVAFAAANGLTGVAAGAFGAHAAADPHMAELLRTGAQYQIVHAAAALAAAARPGQRPLAGWLLAAGALVFAGSLYLLALTGVKAFGAVTPVGGLLMLAGWAALIVSARSDPSG